MIPIALASDTLSIATMEVVDNLVILVIPGALEAGLGDILFWGSLAFSLVVAGAAAMPVNRWLIARGKGHVAVHETGIHGGPPVRVVAIVAAVAGVFGTTVLVAKRSAELLVLKRLEHVQARGAARRARSRRARRRARRRPAARSASPIG